MMKRIMMAVALAATLAVGQEVCGQTAYEWPEVTRDAKAGSRWWLMGSALDQTSVQNRMAEYAGAGIGILEMTPIYGVQGNEANELSYLSTPWMNAYAYTLKAAGENKVTIDMNNGTGWPFGGPKVSIDEAAGKLEYTSGTLTGDGSTLQTLNLKLTSSSQPKLNRVMAYPQGDNTSGPVDVTSYFDGTDLRWTAPAGEWLAVAIYNSHTLQQVKRAAPGGEGYVLDHFNPNAVAGYLQRFEDAFRNADVSYPRCFFNDSYEVYYADWTPLIFEEFRKYRGYGLEDNMDILLGLGTRKDTDNQVLADYRETLNDMLLNNFTRQWTDWAHSHGALTRNQAHGSPGNLIDLYAAVDIPEIEGFGLSDFGIKGLRKDEGFTRVNYSDFSTLKYASSAAHVTGKTLVSSETFTWLTEHFRTSLSQMKPDLDLMFAAGVNHVFFHGTTYTPDGVDWPGWKFYAAVDMSPTNTIWRDAPELMGYIERCQSFLQWGEPDNDLLVYVPFRRAWHKSTGTMFSNRLLTFPIDNIAAKLPEFSSCVGAIEKAGLDCDYISERLLLSTVCADGELQTASGARYKALVVPVSDHISPALQAHLDELKGQGAKIVYGYEAQQLAEISEARTEPLRTQLGLKVIRRRNSGGYHYFISNLTPDDVKAYVPLGVDWKAVAQYNPLTGVSGPAVTVDGQVYVCLRSGESVILRTYTDGAPDSGSPSRLDDLVSIPLDRSWTLSFAPDAVPAVSRTWHLDSLQTWETLDSETAALAGTGIYETTFTVSPTQMDAATGGFRVELGDVRESARVYVNGQYVGCAWCAPFAVSLGDAVKSGENVLRVEVTNLPANRIRQMDIDGRKWRIFKDVNILDISKGNIGVSGITSYADWELMPSGLNGRVKVVPMRRAVGRLTAELTEMRAQQTETYAPQYRLTMDNGGRIASVDVRDASGYEFKGVETQLLSDGSALVSVTGLSDNRIIVTATDAGGAEADTQLPAYGLYAGGSGYDFASTEPPLCGWNNAVQADMTGFEGKYERRVAKAQGKDVTTLYDGLRFTSTATNVFYLYPGYGMNCNSEARMSVENASCGDIVLVSYKQGDEASTTVWQSADSVTVGNCMTEADESLSVTLKSKKQYAVYRSVAVYSPIVSPASVNHPGVDGRPVSGCYYTLQGQRVKIPYRGIYIKDGRKVVVK